MRNVFYYLWAILIFTGCSSTTKIVKFPKKPDEVFANNNLKDFFRVNKTPNIVLRVPNSSDKATSNTSIGRDNSVLYNSIEKELLKQGFSVRDRGLFNEIMDKAGSTQYSQIKDLTNTDLILEVIEINPAVLYTTNKVVSVYKKAEKDNVGSIDYKMYGAAVEFRLIMVKNNEIAGSYKYNYPPCPYGCELESFKLTGKNKQIELKETVSISVLEEFLKICIQDLIKSIGE